ncbi:hypothetical protein Unana1_00381 [Umbelopsis nana]
MAAHKLAKMMSWVKEDFNDPASNVRRNSSIHSKVYSSQTSVRHNAPHSLRPRPITKANGAIIVKTSDFLPSNPQGELAVRRKQSHLSLRSDDGSDSTPVSFGNSSDYASVSSAQANSDLAPRENTFPETSTEVNVYSILDGLETGVVAQSELIAENQGLKRSLEIARLQVKETQKRCDDIQKLADSRESEANKLNALVSSLRCLMSQTNHHDTCEDCTQNTKAGEIDTEKEAHCLKIQGLLDELVAEQRKYFDLNEKHQALNKTYSKISLQQIENEEIIKELQRDMAILQSDIERYEGEKERMQSRLNNYVWKAQFASNLK